MRLSLSIVVPAFNESTRLAAGMRRFREAVTDGAVDLEQTEVIVVDDGSTDDTEATAWALLADLPHHRVVRLPLNGGKGAAVRAGVAAARGAHTAFMDADMAIDPRAVPLLLDRLQYADVAIGSRALPSSMVETRYAVRTMMGQLFNRLVTTGTGLGLRDTQCGFKAFRTPVARTLFHLAQIDGFAFDVELLLWARRLGLRIAEIPVQWKHVPGSTIHPLHDSFVMLADVYRSRLGMVEVPPVPALTVRTDGLADEAEQVHAAVRGLAGDLPLPVLIDGPTTIVLLPLVPSGEAAELTADLTAKLAPQTVERRSFSGASLRRLQPLHDRLALP